MMDPDAFLSQRRQATQEELEEGRKQIEEADRRMKAEGLEVKDPTSGRPGSDGQFLGSVSSGDDMRMPAGRPADWGGHAERRKGGGKTPSTRSTRKRDGGSTWGKG